MAGLGGLPYFIQYQGQLQEQAAAKQQQQMQLMQFQQQQQDRQRQQAAMAAAGNALPQLVAPPPQQPAPQPPAPGQASQPMQQAGGGVPLPQGPVPGLRPPLPPGGAQGAMPPAGIPPFRPMPTTPPQSAAPQGAIPAPPAQAAATPANDQMEGGFSLSNIIQSGQKQGLSGSDLYDYVQTMEPYMTAQQKAQADKFKTTLELKKLDAEIALHSQAAQNQQLSLKERERHDQALEDLASRRADISQGNLNIRIQGAGGGPQAPTPPEVKPGGELPPPQGGGGLSGQTVDMIAERKAAGDEKAAAGYARNKAAMAAIDNRVAQRLAAQGKTGTDITTGAIEQAANRRGAIVNAQQAAKVDAAANALTREGGIATQFQKAIDDLDRLGIPVANQAQMQILRAKFDPRIATYDTARNAIMSEVAAIINRGQPLTVQSLGEAQLVVDGWHTSEQARAGIAQLRREADSTVAASREEVKRSARGGKEPAASAPAIPTGWTVTEH